MMQVTHCIEMRAIVQIQYIRNRNNTQVQYILEMKKTESGIRISNIEKLKIYLSKQKDNDIKPANKPDKTVCDKPQAD